MSTTTVSTNIDKLVADLRKVCASVDKPNGVKGAVKRVYNRTHSAEDVQMCQEWVDQVKRGLTSKPTPTGTLHESLADAALIVATFTRVDKKIGSDVLKAIGDIRAVQLRNYNPDRYGPAVEVFWGWYNGLMSRHAELIESICQLKVQADKAGVVIDPEMGKDDIQEYDPPTVYGLTAGIIMNPPGLAMIIANLHLLQRMQWAESTLQAQITNASKMGTGDRLERMMGLAVSDPRRRK